MKELEIATQPRPEDMFTDFLDKDEQIIKVFKPDKKRFYKGLWPMYIPLFWPHLLLAIIFTAGIFPFVYMKKSYDNLYYAYTNKRLIVRSGGFGVNFFGIEYKDIIATNVEKTFLDKNCDTGSISFRSYHTSIGFRYIKQPYDVMREIKDYMSTLS